MTTEFEFFNSSWSVYRKVVDLNYMNHRQFGERTKEYLKRIPGRLRILDLGCGDAIEMAHYLQSIDVEQYTGCDLSRYALDLAGRNLSGIGGVTLIQESMENLLGQETRLFNLIHSSFAIHHLSDTQKGMVLDRIFQLLEPGGIFLLIDVFRLPGQSRPHYISRYLRMLREDWSGLSEPEKDLIEEHIIHFDFPADEDDVLSMARNAGFNQLDFTSPDEHHKMILFQKPTMGGD